MTERAQTDLQRGRPDDDSILTDQYGPLWYRGLAGVAPEAPSETVDRILSNHEAAHIVIGHTPTGGFIWPRYGGRVVQIDTGIGSAYGGHIAYLEITPEGLFAGYQLEKIELPADEAELEGYLEKLTGLLPDNDAVRKKLEAVRARALTGNGVDAAEKTKTDAAGQARADARQTASMNAVPICGTRS